MTPSPRAGRRGLGPATMQLHQVESLLYTELFTILYTLNSKAVRYALVTSFFYAHTVRRPLPTHVGHYFPPLPYVCMHSKCSSGLAPRKQSRKTRAQRASPLTHPAQ